MAIQSRILFLLLLISAIYSSCKSKTNSMNSDKKEPTMSTNPLIDPWSGPYNGVPPFDKVKIEDFIPSLEMAMNQKREEINAITANPEKPNFKNTIEALEKTGLALKRFQGVYYVWTSNMATPALDSIQATVEPRFASFNDSIIQNSQLFARIEAIQNDTASLTAEEKRLWWRYHTTFVLAGAKMDAKSKERVAAINQQLASLFTKFSQNQLKDEGEKYLEIKDAKDLDGLSESMIAAAAESAKSKNKVGSWVINNTRSAIEPFLTNCKNRSLREKAWRMFINRGDNGDANDNNAIIPQILALRAERAKLLGFETHAHLRLADKMAQTPEKALSLLESVWPFAIDRVKEEVTDMQKLADKMGDKIKIEAWDYRYYAEKVRKDKYDLDESEVKQYLELENLREGMFFMASELFNMKFTQIKDVPVFHPDVRVYRVNDIKSDKLIGLWYFDPYARQGKRSGAWMTAYREQEKLNGDITTIVSNNCNFLRGKENEPILISWEDAETLFHEFGHALHGLCSNVKYPSLSGTNVATDYVEFPSQILERWLSTKEILQKYALHYKTKEPMPQSLLDKIKNASKFNQGFATVEYLASALIDMKLHLAGAQKIDADKFERETLLALKMPKEMVMRHRTPQFGHIFADDGYSAGYYSYLWSEVLSADAWEAFTEAGGAYDKTVGKRLYDYVFSVGGTMDESTAYSLFRGKEPTKNALMKARGFKVE
ncbi:MAG: M3 family metallopeptidase [Saprospiraceae bacterium]|nr:M3 family metallopeptidase [Saprospiraceae bacterium]